MNKKNILKIIVENINMFEDNRLEIDFTNDQQISNHDKSHPYYNVKSSIYLPKVLAFKGVNASGKTTVLEIISFVFDVYFNDSTINNNYSLLEKIKTKNPLIFTMFYEHNSVIYKIESEIIKKIENIGTDDDPLLGYSYVINEEIIYSKLMKISTSKKDLFTKGYNYLISRDLLDENIRTFLPDYKSMIGILGHKNNQLYINNLQSNSNKKENRVTNNKLELVPSIIQYLDPSIKSIKEVEVDYLLDDTTIFQIQFKNGKKIETTKTRFRHYLSSGTYRGIQILQTIKAVLRTGGYYVLDELEVHFNKTIAVDIIKLFLDHKTNPNNATLLFSTHYTELIDTLTRNDQVILIHRNDNYDIKLTRFSKLNKKNQNKKSESYFSDEFKIGTAIEYETYMKFRNTFIIKGEN